MMPEEFGGGGGGEKKQQEKHCVHVMNTNSLSVKQILELKVQLFKITDVSFGMLILNWKVPT